MSSLKEKVAQRRKSPSTRLSKSSPGVKKRVSLAEYFVDSDSNSVVSFKNLLDAYLRTNPKFILKGAGISRNKLIGFHPSSLHNNCSRRIAFGLINEKKLFTRSIVDAELDDIESWITPRLRRTFDTGHMLHFLVQYGYLVGMSKKYAVEIPNISLYKKYLIGGTSDITITLQDKKDWILDLKSIKQEMFYKLDENDYSTIQINYIIQLLLYMFGLKLNRGGIVYWNKNTGDIKEFYFVFPSVAAIKPFIQKELDISLVAKAFLLGKNTSILAECNREEGKYKKCEFSSICFRCSNPKDLLVITKAKKLIDFIK